MKNLAIDDAFSPQALLPTLPRFAEKIEALSQLIGLDTAVLSMDHIAMRINQLDAAVLAHEQWMQLGSVISQALINGRPIIVIELDESIKVGRWTTNCIELPYPAQGKNYPEQGWEHVEFVVPWCKKNHVSGDVSPVTPDNFEDLVKQLFPKLAFNWPSLKSMGVVVKASSPQGEGERLSNPTLAFKWNGVCVKLHPYSLKQVIESENH